MQTNVTIATDCLDWMRQQPDDSVSLVLGSPPYENARTYGIGFSLKGQAWVDWMVERMIEMVRISRGLIAMVVEGKTSKFRWSATPALLMADLHRAGVHLRKPPAFARVGIPGSGGPDWLRNDYEFIVCCTAGGKLPWSDNTAMGHPPKWAPGGEMSNRHADGRRINAQLSKQKASRNNRDAFGFTPHTGEPSETQRKKGKKRTAGKNQWGHSINSGATDVGKGGWTRSRGKRPSHVTCGSKDGDTQTLKSYDPPVKANPGNVIKCIVGGGVMGSKFCHDNEAPFPESLAEFFVRSFCPPDGIVLDPFMGSGTTCDVALQHGRQYIGIDVRRSQVALANRRLAERRAAMKEARA